MAVKKNYSYPLLAFFVVVLAFVFYNKIKDGQLSSEVNELGVTGIQKLHEGTLNLKKPQPKTKNQDDTVSQQNSEKNLSKPETTFYNKIDATFRWQTEHLGYYYTGIIASDYDNYDLDTLKDLGQQGDMHALDVLAWRYKKEKNYDAALSAYHSAAVLGSSAALEEIARLTNENVGSREGALHILSYLQTAVLRGDQQALTSAAVQMKVLNDNHEKLTTFEIKNIQQQGVDRYLNLEGERKKKGLSRFDNTVPEYTEQYYLKARKRAGIEFDLTRGTSPVFVTTTKQQK